MQQNTDRVMQIGNVYNKGGEKGSDGGNVYDPSGISRTLTSYGGGAAQTYILEPFMYRVPYGKTRLGGIVPNNIAGTLSASSHEYNELVIEPIMEQNTDINPEPQMLTMQRTEEAKRLRRVNGDVGVSFRGSKEYTIKSDGVSNTLTTFTEKECLVAEPMALGYSRDSKPDENGVYHTHRKFTDVMNALCPCRRDENECLVAEPAIRPVGNIYPSKAQSGKVVDPDGIAPALNCCGGGNLTPQILEPQPLVTKHPYQSFGKVKFTDEAPTILSTDFKPHLVKEPVSCAMRGRNPDRPSDRTSGIPTEQRIEIGGDIANCLTSVQKDSMVIEPMVSAHPLSHACENPQPRADVAPTLRATDYKCPPVAYEPFPVAYRIRKLTPKERFRLMDVDDPDIDKLIDAKDKKGKPELSKSACYKLAGNSIVVSCMFFIFENLFYPKSENQKQLKLF